MQYDFDRWPDRLNTNSVKWDELPFKNVKEGFIPLWVADMDFPVAPEIIGAMKERLDHPYFGYFSLTDENFYRPIIEWQKARYGVEGLEPGQILYENGVLAGIAHLLQALSSPGDPVVLQTPGYPGFEGVLNTMNRKIIPNPMIDNGGYFTIDYRDLEKKIVDSGAKILLFCSPAEPDRAGLDGGGAARSCRHLPEAWRHNYCRPDLVGYHSHAGRTLCSAFVRGRTCKGNFSGSFSPLQKGFPWPQCMPLTRSAAILFYVKNCGRPQITCTVTIPPSFR